MLPLPSSSSNRVFNQSSLNNKFNLLNWNFQFATCDFEQLSKHSKRLNACASLPKRGASKKSNEFANLIYGGWIVWIIPFDSFASRLSTLKSFEKFDSERVWIRESRESLNQSINRKKVDWMCHCSLNSAQWTFCFSTKRFRWTALKTPFSKLTGFHCLFSCRVQPIERLVPRFLGSPNW